MANRQGVHWFPGHMKAALGAIAERLKIVDLVIVVGDARAPFSSINPYLTRLLGDKNRVLVLAKADLADERKFKTVLSCCRSSYEKIFIADLKAARQVAELKAELLRLETDKSRRYRRLGLKTPPLRALVAGIPNVGKSTFINALAQRRKAGVANKPGFTRNQQLIKVSDSFELYDTPGILPANYEDRGVATRLAWIGSLKLEVLPLEQLVGELADFLLYNYRERLVARYRLPDSVAGGPELISAIAAERHYLKSGGELDRSRAEMALLKDFQNGDLGRIIVDDLERI